MRAPSAIPCLTGRWTRASQFARSPCTRGSRSCRPAQGSSPTPTLRRSTRSASGSSRRSSSRSSWRRRGGDSSDRQLRLVHLQPGAPVRRARLRGESHAKRRDRRGGGGGSRAEPPCHLTRPRPASGRGSDGGDRQAREPARAHPRRLPRTPGDRRSFRRRDRAGQAPRPREGEPGSPRRAGDLRRPAGGIRGGALPLARRDRRSRGARDLGNMQRRRGDGREASTAPDRWGAVPPGVGADSRRAGAHEELPRGARVIQQALARLLEGRDLSREDARAVMGSIMSGEATPAQIAGFLIALRAKGETADEIAGCAEAMREHALPVRPRRGDLVDTAGTGGDDAKTINISTAAALVASASGSADVLEALGFRLELPAERIAQSIDELGFGFLFAPTHHPAMRHAAPVRKELATRTVFNVLGPLTNPAGARAQVVGVFSPALVPTIADVLLRLGAQRAFVVHGAFGIDELSPA